MNTLGLMISSVGRRNYLVRWFSRAASVVGCDVDVWAGDGDPHAPGLVDADRRVTLPPIASRDYLDELVNICVGNEISLLLSLHDYDISTISRGALDRLREAGIIAAVPPITTLDIVTDKMMTVERLLVAGLHVPSTSLATDQVLTSPLGASVVKHRYGSGSSGVFIVDPGHLSPAITMSAASAPRVDGTRPATPDLSLVVIQEKIEGDEFGLDVVCDFHGNFQGVLARKKLRMRAGETDRAVTVDPAPFRDIAARLAATLELRGNTDVDVIVTPEGDPYIIDINPRFGGGYPFVHLAGANVPACYLAWTAGQEIDPAWLQYEVGVVSSKYEAVHRAGT